jgi:hypothetical protein
VTTRRDFLVQTTAGFLASRLPRRTSLHPAPDDITLANETLSATWSASAGSLRAVRVVDRETGAVQPLSPDAFSLLLGDGTLVRATDLVAGTPRLERFRGDERASRMSERSGGQRLVVDLADRAGRLRASWRAILGDGSRYLRQEIELVGTGPVVPIVEVHLVDPDLPGAAVAGSVRGSPIVGRAWFAAFEHPLAQARVEAGRARAWLDREPPLRPGAPLTCSSVIGAVGSGSVRRTFLEYLERERAHPYRPFLHYNSWYDLGYFLPFDEPGALGVITAFGTELHERRNVVLDSFLFDDGWDDPQTLWRFHAGFPHGFTPLRDPAARYGCGILVLRNPKDEPQTFEVDVREALELPEGGPGHLTVKSPWRDRRDLAPLTLTAGAPHPFRLEPFEVRTLEALP